ncbi:hypothetical protein JW859_07980 [bacterium]|nr:hypothetical protein [bacterium]
MWECWNCGFQNVDAAPVCAKCRARKPAEGESYKGRSFHSMQEAAKERVADEVLAKTFPVIPKMSEVRANWLDVSAKPSEIPSELARLELRQLKLREAMRLMLNLIKNPKAKGADEMMINVYNTLLNWDEE